MAVKVAVDLDQGGGFGTSICSARRGARASVARRCQTAPSFLQRYTPPALR
jgi:hypothetical protein